jgi:hypothetical protein
MAVVDSRLANLEWRVTEGVTAVLPVSFLDDAGDALPVDTWAFSALIRAVPGAAASGTATVDTTQAAVGQVSVTLDDSLSSTLGSGSYVWSLIWTVSGEPTGGLGGALVIDEPGARGASGLVVTT